MPQEEIKQEDAKMADESDKARDKEQSKKDEAEESRWNSHHIQGMPAFEVAADILEVDTNDLSKKQHA